MDLDIYPATLTTPTGRHERVRIILTGGRVYVFSDPRTLVASADASGYAREGRSWRITTTDGDWSAAKAGGCGCRDPLKRQSQKALLAVAESDG